MAPSVKNDSDEINKDTPVDINASVNDSDHTDNFDETTCSVISGPSDGIVAVDVRCPF